MSKQLTPDGPAPKVYDTEKIIDIHSPECDPSFDSKKVREVKSYVPQAKFSDNPNKIKLKNENKLNFTEETPPLVDYYDSNIHKDSAVYDYRGKL